MAAAASSAGRAAQGAPPRFVVDLDLPPRLRWRPVVQAFASRWAQVVRAMWSGFDDADPGDMLEEKSEQRQFVRALCERMLQGLHNLGHSDYVDELHAIAQGGGIDVADLVLLHLSYESFEGCTSIVALDAQGNACLARTLDWDLADLKQLTIDVEFRRGGQLLYVATTWAGYIGILTAMVPGKYAVAINYRFPTPDAELDEESQQPYRGSERTWPIGFLVRHVLESDKVATYAEALHQLAFSPIMSSCYVIMAGVGAQGAILTRSELHEHSRLEMTPSGVPFNSPSQEHDSAEGPSNAAGKGSSKRPRKRQNPQAQPDHCANCPRLVQANLDHWERRKKADQTDSLPRTQLVHSRLKRAAVVTDELLWSILQEAPIWEDDTIYATLMCPARELDHGYRTCVELVAPAHSEGAHKGSAGRKGRRRRKRR